MVYKETNPEDAQTLDLGEGIVDFAPVDATTVAPLDESGTVYLLDLASGDVTGEVQAPPGTKWLVGP